MKSAVCLAVITLILIGSLGDSRAQEPEKFSLTMFHFNVQYVAGGLKGFPSGTDNNPTFDLDDAQVQDLIIKESFEPVLDVFLKHPAWGVTLEMQAYMVEVMLERHPEVIAKLKQLIDNGQAELVSFHYSDQMFLAYPKLDLERSFELMAPIYAQAGFSPSGTVFCQEGQFGVGMAAFAKEHDRHILVLAKNLFKYQHESDYSTAAPLFTLEGVDIVLGSRSFATQDVEVRWSFFDDGELLATDGQAPYMGTNFVHSQAALDQYEQRLLAEEAEGFRIAKVSEFVDWAKQNNLEQPPLPPILDGTWQPPSTNSMRRWMGGSGLFDAGWACERDNQVLTSNVRTRHWLQVAETLVAKAESLEEIEAGQYSDMLLDCWRDALLGQVTDTTGINPFINEINYGLDHAASALACADGIITAIAPKLGGPYLMIDTKTNQITELDDWPSDTAVDEPPFFTEDDGLLAIAPGRTTNFSWRVLPSGNIHRVTVEASLPSNQERTLEVVFPLTLDGFYLTPGLTAADAIYYPFSEFDFQEGRISLPVANGLVGIGEDLWLVKQTSSVHIAATFLIGNESVRFIDDTLDPDTKVSWIFWIVEGNKNVAVEFADRINLHPVAYVETGVKPGRGCGCGHSANRSGLLGLLLVGLILGLRRTRWPD
ncbi:MAG: hypothetical protein JRJ87_06200 [Deltaproteobacteria bacterium]|nr:hypothetical protein [Deltaproteobacteria bacterium]